MQITRNNNSMFSILSKIHELFRRLKWHQLLPILISICALLVSFYAAFFTQSSYELAIYNVRHIRAKTQKIDFNVAVLNNGKSNGIIVDVLPIIQFNNQQRRIYNEIPTALPIHINSNTVANVPVSFRLEHQQLNHNLIPNYWENGTVPKDYSREIYVLVRIIDTQHGDEVHKHKLMDVYVKDKKVDKVKLFKSAYTEPEVQMVEGHMKCSDFTFPGEEPDCDEDDEGFSFMIDLNAYMKDKIEPDAEK